MGIPPAIDWHRKDFCSMFGLAIAAFGALGSWGDVLESQAMSEQIRDQHQSAIMAEQRYKTGCLPIAINDQPANLAEGIQVLDPRTGTSLPPNVVVCDLNGNTAMIGSGGIVGDFAWTGNAQLVRDSIKTWFDSNSYENLVQVNNYGTSFTTTTPTTAAQNQL